MTPTERNLRAQLDAANIQIRSLERDIRELRDAIDIKTDEIERVRVILGPTAGRRTEAEQAALTALEDVPDGTLKWLRDDGMSGSLKVLAEAVLALREAK